jgi:hypothetical protein
MRVAGVMSTTPGCKYRFGPVEWPGSAAGLYPPEKSWVEAEQRRLDGSVLPLIERKD